MRAGTATIRHGWGIWLRLALYASMLPSLLVAPRGIGCTQMAVVCVVVGLVPCIAAAASPAQSPRGGDRVCRLARVGRPIEVSNLGLPALQPKDYLQMLAGEGMALRPDLVFVCLFAGNDFMRVGCRRLHVSALRERHRRDGRADPRQSRGAAAHPARGEGLGARTPARLRNDTSRAPAAPASAAPSPQSHHRLLDQPVAQPTEDDRDRKDRDPERKEARVREPAIDTVVGHRKEKRNVP